MYKIASYVMKSYVLTIVAIGMRLSRIDYPLSRRDCPDETILSEYPGENILMRLTWRDYPGQTILVRLSRNNYPGQTSIRRLEFKVQVSRQSNDRSQSTTKTFVSIISSEEFYQSFLIHVTIILFSQANYPTSSEC